MSASLRFCAFWASVVLAAGFSAGASRLCAQPIELIALTNVWRYEQNGADLGSAWKETAYNDAAWQEGRGVLAAEAENATVWSLTNTTLSRLGTNGQFKLTDYFRTRFTVTSMQPGWSLIASNLVDDGAVVYLNG